MHWIYKEIHPKRRRFRLCPSTGYEEVYVLEKDVAKGQYEMKYGIPADVDAVWADRERYQNQLEMEKLK